MRLSSQLLNLLLASLVASCSFGGSDIAPRTLNIQGTYDWIDGFDRGTACIARIFWQDGGWRGWIRTNNESTEICPFDGYDLPMLRMRGDRVRMAVACPRSGCPTNIRLSTAYLLDVVPGVMLSGSSVGSEVPLRWRTVKLVRRDES